jgi:4-amino-4-deoxy-L-arabinose transferase-like glycosyltransferase
VAGAALVASAGWWVAVVELWPASDRPYIGGSQTNSVLELVLGYNGLGRITGEQVGSVTGGANQGGGMWGETGWSRLFDNEIGGQVSWLVPAALIFLGALLWVGRRAPRIDRTRAALLLWGGWLLVTGLIFSYMQGIFHAYYTVALAPAIGALVGIGAGELWLHRDRLWARGVLAAALLVTGGWAFVLLGRATGWLPWLRPTVLAGAVLVAAALLVGPGVTRRAGVVIAGAAVLVGLAAPAAYSLQTASTGHSGAIVTAGPAVAGGFGGPGGGRPGGRRLAGPQGGGPPAGMPGQLPGAGPLPGGGQFPGNGQAPGGGNLGGLLRGSTPDAELVALLAADADDYTWVAAAIGSNSAAGVQLATGEPVMAIGGFNGSDPAPTLAQFQRYVAEGKIHYFLGGGIGGNRNGGSDASAEISAWVQENFEPATVGGATVYDLTQGAGTGT